MSELVHFTKQKFTHAIHALLPIHLFIMEYFGINKQNFPVSSERSRAKIVVYFMMVGIATYSTYIIPYLTFMKNYTAFAFLMLLGILPAVYGLYFFKKYRNVNATSRIGGIPCVLTMAFIGVVTGGIHSPTPVMGVAALIICFLLLGGKEGLIATLAYVVFDSILSYSIKPTQFWGFDFAIFSFPHVLFIQTIKSLFILVAGVLCFIFHGLMHSAQKETERSKEIAEKALKTIEEQFLETKAIMNATQTGFAMIYKDLKIVQEKSSSYFQELFPHEIDFLQILKKMKIEQTSELIKSVMGESELSWKLNESSWPIKTEINGIPHKLEWKPIYFQDEIIALVFAADNVAELVMNENKIKIVQREAELLKIVLDNKKGISRFIATKIVDLNESIERAEISLVDNVNPIYIILHTMKGEAGALNLHEIKTLVHETEDLFHKIKTKADHHDYNIESMKIDMIGRLKMIRALVVELQPIFEKLSGDTSKLYLDRGEALDALRTNPEQLRKLVTNALYANLHSSIFEFEKSIYKIAGDLGKPSPRLVIAIDKDFHIEERTEINLKNAMIHIIRNSLDHGIETREERQGQGKTETGEIVFIGGFTGDFFDLKVKDDGRGLNLVKIREKAVRNSLISADARMPNSDIANLIFVSGFTTADSVSLVSGRGIGMNAVQQYLKELNGKAFINLLDHTSMTPSWELVLRLPKNLIIL